MPNMPHFIRLGDGTYLNLSLVRHVAVQDPTPSQAVRVVVCYSGGVDSAGTDLDLYEGPQAAAIIRALEKICDSRSHPWSVA